MMYNPISPWVVACCTSDRALTWVPNEGILMPPELIIGQYALQPPHCVDYDPSAKEVAQRVEQSITELLPAVKVEHIGSTSVPGCAGKGVVDLMVLYPEGQLEKVKETLAELGFQPQTVGHIFPESRPMRVGAVEHKGEWYRLHVHVIAADSSEVGVLLAFRDRLLANPALVHAYVDCKRTILASGVQDPQQYTRLKSDFVQGVLTTQ